jgi:hypothetical protein
MLQRFRFPSLVASAVLTTISMAQSPKVALHIQVDKPLHSVSPKLYGLMFARYRPNAGLPRERHQRNHTRDRDQRASYSRMEAL